MARKIRITACPPGDAPESIREAWIGLELPLPSGRRSRPRHYFGANVVSGPRPEGFWSRMWSIWRPDVLVYKGYAVIGSEAVDVLAEKNPDAAAWWRSNCAFWLDGKRTLIFPSHVCEELP